VGNGSTIAELFSERKLDDKALLTVAVESGIFRFCGLASESFLQSFCRHWKDTSSFFCSRRLFVIGLEAISNILYLIAPLIPIGIEWFTAGDIE
jgi:hypothetical protein